EAAPKYEDNGKSLTIEGAVIGVGRPIVNGVFLLTGPETRISDVTIHGFWIESAALDIGNGAQADRVEATSGLIDGCKIGSTGGTITNSLCVGPSPSSGLSTQSRSGGQQPIVVRNDTMIGKYGYYSNSGTATTITDSIAKRSTGEGADVNLGNKTTALVRTYALHQSGTPLSEEGQLTEVPTFLESGDYREAAGSPSIDFGDTTAEPGELDLNGNLRKIGTKVDLGAYEYVPEAPSVSTPTVSGATTTSATVNATINPNSGRTYYYLEYGSTTAYGTTTPTVAIPAATTPTAVQIALSGLPVDSTLHYRLVATSDGGTTEATDATLKTEPPPPPTPPKKLAPILRFAGSRGGVPKGQPLLDRAAIKLSTGCGPIACNVSVVGKVKIGAKTFGTLPGPKTPSHWQAGKQGAMRLRVSSKLQQSVRKYLEANAGAQAKIFVTATYVTAGGATATRKLKIPVRPI
ncbi:MAG TPA: choice-of-anchor Q domain-containing protein, partial [Solirubrobacterales bacterium]|nr:choice-of-anchor Q domain-containing protein [Solirubrobacterales bacterium]